VFSKISRYRALADEVAVDAQGRAAASKVVRLTPEVDGTFLHVVEDVDRLDHLAFKYYDQPRDWWHIADANPDFFWPPAMIGDDPRRTILVPLTWEGLEPPWVDLVGTLCRVLGVERAQLGTPEQPIAVSEVVQGAPLGDLDRALAVALDASVRTQSIAPALAAALSANGITIDGIVRPEKVDAATWRIVVLSVPSVIYTVGDFPADDLLRVYESGLRFHWILTLTYNALTTSEIALLQRIDDQAFAPGAAAAVRRTGKSIVIPPRAA